MTIRSFAIMVLVVLGSLVGGCEDLCENPERVTIELTLQGETSGRQSCWSDGCTSSVRLRFLDFGNVTLADVRFTDPGEELVFPLPNGQSFTVLFEMCISDEDGQCRKATHQTFLTIDQCAKSLELGVHCTGLALLSTTCD